LSLRTAGEPGGSAFKWGQLDKEQNPNRRSLVWKCETSVPVAQGAAEIGSVKHF